MSFFHIPESSITDVQYLSSWDIGGLRSNFRGKFIDDSSIGKSSSSHNLIVSSTSSISIEVNLLNSFGKKISSSWWILSDTTGRGNVVSCYGISKAAENIGVRDVFNLREV